MKPSFIKLLSFSLLAAITLAATACTDCRRCGFQPSTNVIIQYQGGTQRLAVTDTSGCVYPRPGSGENCDSVVVTPLQ